MTDTRDGFEKFLLTKEYDTKALWHAHEDKSKYRYESTQELWECWQAALQAGAGGYKKWLSENALPELSFRTSSGDTPSLYEVKDITVNYGTWENLWAAIDNAQATEGK